MKNAFDQERIINEKWNINKNFKDVPIYLIKPKNENNVDKMIIYITGLNGNGVLVKYFNYDFFDDFYLFSYDQRAQGDNKNKASKHFKTYLKDLNSVINTIKTKFPFIKHFYLIGESWGSSICFLYDKYFPNVIDKIIGWNMPYKIVDTSTIHGWKKFKNSFNVLMTFLFNINTYDSASNIEGLTNNKLLIRIIHYIKREKLNNKVIIAAWLSFKRSWRYLFKSIDSLDFRYIQSGEDILKTDKIVNKLSNKTNKIVKYKIGYHILTFDDNVSDKLFNDIYTFIME